MEMEIEEGEMVLPPREETPPPAAHKKLRRLKKAATVLDAPIVPTPSPDSDPPVSTSEMPNTEDLPQDGEIPDSETVDVGIWSVSRSEGSDKEMDVIDGLDPLFGDIAPLGDSGTSDFEMELESEGFDGIADGSVGSGEKVDGSKKKQSEKKRFSLEGGDGESKKTKRKKKSTEGRVGEDGKLEESARNRRKLEKENKARLVQLHAESQRLLRETKDASFKPVPVVQRPISSVLEKIRQRKLEMLRSISEVSDSFIEADSLNSDPALPKSVRRRNSESAEDNSAFVVNEQNCEAPESFLDLHKNFCSVLEVSTDSQPSNKEDNPTENCSAKSPDDNGMPSLVTASLNLDSDPLDNSSSGEEDYDKENIDPSPGKLVEVDLFNKKDLVKAFVDDEAEEEDDSDHDLMRFQENDEDEENEENEALNDLIATGYEEMPIDHEKRNELHQKWLEQQDAAATDNVMQRLNCGKKQREPIKVHDEEDYEELEEDSFGDSLNEPLPVNTSRENSRKAKQMMAQMFNEEEDAFVSSDDEETDQRISHRRLIEQIEEKSSFLSPVEDEHSREVFGLIKKLNIAPDPKRRTKVSAPSYDMLVTGGNTNSSFKSSFLGRSTSNSLPSSHKQGSSNVRSFIFSRDDSSSRGSISMSENLSDMNLENQPKKNAPPKFSSSQSKSVSSKAKLDADTTSGASLFQILRRSSTQFDGAQAADQSGSNMVTETQVARQFTAFKLGRKVPKKVIQEV